MSIAKDSTSNKCNFGYLLDVRDFTEAVNLIDFDDEEDMIEKTK